MLMTSARCNLWPVTQARGATHKPKSILCWDLVCYASSRGRSPSIHDTGRVPKKTLKIPLQKLKKAVSGPSFVTIGEILKQTEVREDTVVKGERKNVKTKCVCIDNRVGRMPTNDRGKSGLRFVYISDCTAFMSVGMNASECRLTSYDLSENDCTDSAPLYFSAELFGDLSWVPTKRSPQAEEGSGGVGWRNSDNVSYKWCLPHDGQEQNRSFKSLHNYRFLR